MRLQYTKAMALVDKDFSEEKEGLFNDQQKWLKLGIIKIISSNGQKRLVRKEEVDARKKIEKKCQEIKKK